MPKIWFSEPDTEAKIGSEPGLTEPVSRYVLTLDIDLFRYDWQLNFTRTKTRSFNDEFLLISEQVRGVLPVQQELQQRQLRLRGARADRLRVHAVEGALPGMNCIKNRSSRKIDSQRLLFLGDFFSQ